MGFGTLYWGVAYLTKPLPKSGDGTDKRKGRRQGNRIKAYEEALPTEFRGLTKKFPFSHGSLSVSVHHSGIQAA